MFLSSKALKKLKMLVQTTMPRFSKRYIVCKHCNGNGFFYEKKPDNVVSFRVNDPDALIEDTIAIKCDHCNGSGHVGSYLLDEEK